MFINENLVPIDITSLTTVSDCLFAIASLKRCTTPKALNIRYKSKRTDSCDQAGKQRKTGGLYQSEAGDFHPNGFHF